MKTMQNAMVNSYHGQQYVSFLGVHTDPAQAIAEKLGDFVAKRADHAYGDIYRAVAVRHCTSEHAGFDKKSDGEIFCGNVSSKVMAGKYIRPVDEVTCNGFDFKPGQLQTSDLNAFSSHSARSVFSRWAELVPDMKTETTIAYVFFTYTGRVRTEIGYLLVRAKDRQVLRCHAVGERMKNESVMHAMRALLSSEGISEKTRVASWSESGLAVYDPAIFGLLKAREVPCVYAGPLGVSRGQ